MYDMDEKCRKCKNNGKVICGRCDMFYSEFDPIDEPKQTNADRIRAMNDEELAKELKGIGCPGICRTKYREDDIEQCYKCWLDWLRQEVHE